MRLLALPVRISLSSMQNGDIHASACTPQCAQLCMGRHTWQAVGYVLLRPLMHAHCADVLSEHLT